MFLGSWNGVSSPASVEHPAVGVGIVHRAGESTWALDRSFEYAVYCAVGTATINGAPVRESELLALPRTQPGLEELMIHTDGDARLIVLGGAPWTEPLFMWWNFVARSKSEVTQAIEAWSSWPARSTEASQARFAALHSPLDAIPTPPLP